ncbi:transporter substrate-binding domain-containing protein [uncultured Lentibacter sp.]|uniref:transporter substrate-binding domain-containing protein n=1 Tax=uncultured Lentibacter sp. TaxID=1659309 RepID=UPI002621A2AE|nr:transporter substrate-binding domain-containing protein [uncultured Lentibacter sp.]
MRRLVQAAGLALLGVVMSGQMAQAVCNVSYRVQPEDTLFSIAQTHYGDSAGWTLIYYANQGVLEAATGRVVVGSEVYIPCPARSAAADATPLRGGKAEISLLTGGDYAPFTDRDWPGQGMATELVNAALELAPQPVPYEIVWEDDWAQHLFPLLDSKAHDMGFPWLKPDCAATPDNARCANFHFSEPLMDLPIMLFAKVDSGLVYESDADVVGKRLCRPKGYFTHDLDRAGRHWLTQEKVTLVQADSPDACFAALMAGEVDAVTVNIFLGARKVVELGLKGQVLPLETPLSREALYVIISKKHWRGTTLMYRLNAGLAALKASGRYGEIVARHLKIFQDELAQ